LSLFCCCWIFQPAILPMFVTTKFLTPSISRHQYEYIWDLSNVYFIFYQIFTTWVRFAGSHQLFLFWFCFIRFVVIYLYFLILKKWWEKIKITKDSKRKK
jgi:hypothetical protein